MFFFFLKISKFHLEIFKYTFQSMKIFISYATQDLLSFRISEIVQYLEAQKEIEKVWYWDRDSKDFSSIITYMEFGITNCDVFLAMSTKAFFNSAPVNQEIDLAIYSNKKMIPVFENIKDVRPLLRPKTGVKFNSSKFQDFVANLLFILTNEQKKNPQVSEIRRESPFKESIKTSQQKIQHTPPHPKVKVTKGRTFWIKKLPPIADSKNRSLEEKQLIVKQKKLNQQIDTLVKRFQMENLSEKEEIEIVNEINELDRILEDSLADTQRDNIQVYKVRKALPRKGARKKIQKRVY